MEEPLALAALEKTDYPPEKIEVIIAKGRRPALQRNAGAREAEGEILFFLDDDSVADPDLFRENVTFYKDPTVVGVGGPALPLPPETKVQAASDVVLASIFGDFRGCMRFARRGPARPVSEDEVILCNLSVRKSVFDEVRGFHDALYPNEENEFLQKVLNVRKADVFMYAPDAVIRRPRPATVGEFWRKVFGYGTGRLEQTLIRPSPICFLRLSAVLFPLYWILLPLLAFLTPWAFAPAVAYLAGNAVMSVKIWFTVRSTGVSLAAFALFPVMHAAYPCGIIWAATGRRIMKRRRGGDDIRVVGFKRFSQAWRGA
jgi:glycosyltransferase involved in cell wall biosynthesis